MVNVYATADSILGDIDAETEPRWLTKHQAVDVLEIVLDGVRCRLEALREDIANGQFGVGA